MVEALPLLGMCNLCLNEGAVKSMLLGHKHNGINEVYAEMLVKCFTIDVSSYINRFQTDNQLLFCKKQKNNSFFLNMDATFSAVPLANSILIVNK